MKLFIACNPLSVIELRSLGCICFDREDDFVVSGDSAKLNIIFPGNGEVPRRLREFEQLTVLYNDPYVSFLRDLKHPRFLGYSARECWREMRHTIYPIFESVQPT